MLPEELRGAYESAFTASEDEEKLVKAADKLSALRQCIEERKAGNPRISLRRGADAPRH